MDAETTTLLARPASAGMDAAPTASPGPGPRDIGAGAAEGDATPSVAAEGSAIADLIDLAANAASNLAALAAESAAIRSTIAPRYCSGFTTDKVISPSAFSSARPTLGTAGDAVGDAVERGLGVHARR